MKKIFGTMLVLSLLVLVLTFPVSASHPNQAPADPPITAEQVVLLGAVATALTFGLRLLFEYGKIKLGRVWVNVILFIVSTFFAFQWANLTFPPLPADVGGYWDWLNAVLLLIMPIFGVASFIYNLLYTKVVVPLTARLLK